MEVMRALELVEVLVSIRILGVGSRGGKDKGFNEEPRDAEELTEYEGSDGGVL